MTFSRYAGPGSHRYPVGFSGDTITTWESLDFQPYFTATASNIGYGWWSHDIGGHMQGYKNDEMTARWTQFGVYSPIMRLHSSCSEFNGKEPWRFKPETAKVMGEFLRERHRMMPYLYTMNYRSWSEDLPLVLPMYYEHPENEEAYQVNHQYYFGSELVVAAITTPRMKKLNVAKTDVWLPEGQWYDIYTGMLYKGNRRIDMYRTIDSIPVLAKAGAIIPYTDDIGGADAERNPKSLRVKVFAGADGEFALYEDDNTTCGYEDGIWVKTEMQYTEDTISTFTIHSVEDQYKILPEKRSYTIEMVGYEGEAVNLSQVLAGNEEIVCSKSYCADRGALVISLPEVDITQRVVIQIPNNLQKKENHTSQRCFEFLNQAEIEFCLKDKIYQIVTSEKPLPLRMSELTTMNLEKDLYGALTEILTANCR